MIEIFGYSISVGHLLYSSGAALSLAAFVLTDILFLRIVVIFANVLTTFAGLMYSNVSIIVWAVLFIVLNSIMVVLLLLKRLPLLVPEDIKPLYKLFKNEMSPREFMRIISLCSLINLKKGSHLVRHDEEALGLLILKSGEVQVIAKGVTVQTIPSCHFVGEISSFFDHKVTADVICFHDVEFYRLDIDVLERLKKSDSLLYEKLFLSVSHAMCDDLIAMNDKLAASRLI